jgi:acyl carrier protein
MKTNKSEENIKELLASNLGVEPDDINHEDFISDDLHMSASDFSDFVLTLQENGYNTKNIELDQIETVGDLIETLTSEDLS